MLPASSPYGDRQKKNLPYLPLGAFCHRSQISIFNTDQIVKKCGHFKQYSQFLEVNTVYALRYKFISYKMTVH